MKYSIQHITQWITAENIILVDQDATIQFLCFDTRKIVQAPNTLFFALVGERRNGHHFIEKAYDLGIRNFVVNESVDQDKMPKANFLFVKNTLTALQQLTQNHRLQFDIPVIGITGSNGKTIVKEWLFQLLRTDDKIVRSPKSYNSQIGVPMSVWRMNKSHQLAIFEAGISQKEEMDKLSNIIQCTLGVFTNIGDAHSLGFASIKEKIAEKIKLFASAKTIVYCKDHRIIDDAFSTIKNKKYFTWGQDATSNLIVIGNEIVDNQREIKLVQEEATATIHLPFIDDASFENAMHGIAMMRYLDYDFETIKKRIQQLEPLALRLELKQGLRNCVLVNDSYNADLDSLQIGLDFLRQQHSRERLVLILSDIFQTGEEALVLNQKIANLINEKEVQDVVLIGAEILGVQTFLNKTIQVFYYPSTQHFLKQLHAHRFRNASILLKGARSFGFEKIAQKLEKKSHNTVLEINLNALKNNLKVYTKHLQPGKKIMAMVKASAYGSGSFEVARLLEVQGVDYLTVAYPDEGMELREAGIQLPIMVLNAHENSFDVLLQYQLEPEIFSFKQLGSFIQFLEKEEIENPWPIHLKLDTGMHRLGFQEKDINALVKVIQATECVKVKSIFSHLTSSDIPAHDAFSKKQFLLFEKMKDQLKPICSKEVLAHLLNSGGILRFPNYQLDMVRLGIGLYGIDSTGMVQEELQVVSTLKATISQIKEVNPLDTVGYNRAGEVTEPKRIGTISIGYADGYDRAFSQGKGRVWIKGKLAPVIGNVCMDMTIIDLTQIPNAEEGDEVIVFGKEIPIQQLAKQLGTIPYEVLTDISSRVKRVYYED